MKDGGDQYLCRRSREGRYGESQRGDDRFAGGKPGADTAASLKLLWSPQCDRGKQFRLVRAKRLVVVDKPQQKCPQLTGLILKRETENKKIWVTKCSRALFHS